MTAEVASVDTMEDMTNEQGCSLSLEEQEKKLSETAKAEYLAAGVKKMAALEKLKEWDAFFAQRGINPQAQIDRLTTAVASTTEQVSAINMNEPNNKFVMKYAEEHAKEGFTLGEIVKAALGEQIIKDTKESRQMLYGVVFELRNSGKLADASFQRDSKTVFVLSK